MIANRRSTFIRMLYSVHIRYSCLILQYILKTNIFVGSQLAVVIKEVRTN